MSDITELAAQPADPVVAAAPSAPAIPAVGDTVRLATGATMEVRGVRRSADALSLLHPGGDWLDGVGAEVIAQD